MPACTRSIPFASAARRIPGHRAAERPRPRLGINHGCCSPAPFRDNWPWDDLLSSSLHPRLRLLLDREMNVTKSIPEMSSSSFSRCKPCQNTSSQSRAATLPPMHVNKCQNVTSPIRTATLLLNECHNIRSSDAELVLMHVLFPIFPREVEILLPPMRAFPKHIIAELSCDAAAHEC